MPQVYALIDPRSNKVRYVGLSKDMKRRYKTHLAGPTPTTRDWLAELSSLKMAPVLVLLEEVTENDGGDIEFEWIFFYQRLHGNLLNRRSDIPRVLKSKVINWSKHREILSISPTFSIEYLERRLGHMYQDAVNLERQIEFLKQKQMALAADIERLKSHYDPQKVAEIHKRIYLP